MTKNEIIKKALCFAPGVGVPMSAYCALSKDKSLNNFGKAGLGIFGISISMMIPGMVNFAFLIAGFYIYLGIMAFAASWGFIALALIWKAVTGKKFEWTTHHQTEVETTPTVHLEV